MKGIIFKLFIFMQDKITEKNIISLIRIALGNSNANDFLEHTDWGKILLMSQKQGVRCLVYEALETLKRNKADIKIFPHKMQIMQCYAQTIHVERMYASHIVWAKELVELWKQHGIKTIVFKGLAHCRYYSKPEHREFGDFDCYLIDAHGNCAYRQGNDIARTNGLIVDNGWYKHSHIAYKKLTIENHQFFTAARRGGTDKALHQYMVETIGDGSQLERLDGSDIYVLPLMTEGLFMLYHSLLHFLVEGINLRHFVDWACWIKANQDKVVWADFYAKCQRFKLDGFVDVLNTIAVKYLGVELYDPTIFADSAYAERTIESALYDDTAIYNRSKGIWYERVHVIGNAFKHSWKYRDVAHYSMVGYVWQFVYGFLKKGEED